MPGSGTSVPGFGTRREAREDALAVLYEAEIAGGSAFEALAQDGGQPLLNRAFAPNRSRQRGGADQGKRHVVGGIGQKAGHIAAAEGINSFSDNGFVVFA